MLGTRRRNREGAVFHAPAVWCNLHYSVSQWSLVSRTCAPLCNSEGTIFFQELCLEAGWSRRGPGRSLKCRASRQQAGHDRLVGLSQGPTAAARGAWQSVPIMDARERSLDTHNRAWRVALGCSMDRTQHRACVWAKGGFSRGRTRDRLNREAASGARSACVRRPVLEGAVLGVCAWRKVSQILSRSVAAVVR